MAYVQPPVPLKGSDNFTTLLAKTQLNCAASYVRRGIYNLEKLQDAGKLPRDTDWRSFEKMALAVIGDILDAAGMGK